jgi:hypothetical protein
MIDKQDGGPAFPLATSSGSNESVNGMSLRDWFAGQTLAGMCANAEESYHPYEELAKRAYLQADAMITERGKQ